MWSRIHAKLYGQYFFDHVWVIQWRRFAFSINNVGIIDNPYAKKNLKTQGHPLSPLFFPQNFTGGFCQNNKAIKRNESKMSHFLL